MQSVIRALLASVSMLFGGNTVTSDRCAYLQVPKSLLGLETRELDICSYNFFF